MTSPGPDVARLLASLDAGATSLAGVDWTTVATVELPSVAAGLASVIGRLQAVQVVTAERLEATDAAAGAGWASAKDFLTHLSGGRKGAGGSILRLAEQTRDLPAVRTAMLEGRVSPAQARVIGTRVGTLPRVPELREAAAADMLDQVTTHAVDATDLDRGFGHVIDRLDPDGKLLADDRARDRQERGAHAARFFSLTPDEVGGVVVRGYGTAEDAELIRTTLAPLTAPQTTERGACGGDPDRLLDRDAQGRRLDPGCPTPGCAHTGTDRRDHGVRMWDALVETCRRIQDTDTLPQTHGTSARITVTIDHAALLDQLLDHEAAGSPRGEGLLGSGQSLSAHAVRRLACDADILPAVLGSHGQVLDLGRTQRLVTTAIWNALLLRDRHCTFPGCSRPPAACEAHHIIHWADGGPTSLDNLTLVCRRHHTITHQTPWHVSLDPTTRRPVWTPPPPAPQDPRWAAERAGTGPPIRPPLRPVVRPPLQPLVREQVTV